MKTCESGYFHCCPVMQHDLRVQLYDEGKHGLKENVNNNKCVYEKDK